MDLPSSNYGKEDTDDEDSYVDVVEIMDDTIDDRYNTGVKEEEIQNETVTIEWEKDENSTGSNNSVESMEIIEVKNIPEDTLIATTESMEEDVETYGFDDFDVEDSRYTKNTMVKVAVGKGLRSLDCEDFGMEFKGFESNDVRSSTLRRSIIRETVYSSSPVPVDSQINTFLLHNTERTGSSISSGSSKLSSSSAYNPYAKRYFNKLSTTSRSSIKSERLDDDSVFNNNNNNNNREMTEDTLDVSSPLKAWEHFFTESILNRIVQHVNVSIGNRKRNNSEEHHETTTIEMKTFFGILYMTSWLEQCGFPMNCAFTRRGGTGIDFILATMSYKRFKYLFNNLQFLSAATTTTTDDDGDHLRSISWLLTDFLERCQLNYELSDVIVIRERVRKFRGKCAFIKDRHKVHGIKIKPDLILTVLLDAVDGYVYNVTVRTEREQHDSAKLSTSISRDVLKLVEPIVDRVGRTLFTDDKITTVPLYKQLAAKKKRGLKSIGYIQRNRLLLERIYSTDSSSLPLRGSKFTSDKNLTFVVYIPKKGQVTYAVSTGGLRQTDRNTGKPLMIDLYEKTMARIEASENRFRLLNLTRAPNWQCGILFSLLEVAAINAYLIFNRRSKTSTDGNDSFAIFLKNLACSLTTDFMLSRLDSKKIENTDTESKYRMMRIARLNTNWTPSPDINYSIAESLGIVDKNDISRRVRCHYCVRFKDRKTRYRCFDCEKFVCFQHSVFLCKPCSNSRVKIKRLNSSSSDRSNHANSGNSSNSEEDDGPFVKIKRPNELLVNGNRSPIEDYANSPEKVEIKSEV